MSKTRVLKKESLIWRRNLKRQKWSFIKFSTYIYLEFLDKHKTPDGHNWVWWGVSVLVLTPEGKVYMRSLGIITTVLYNYSLAWSERMKYLYLTVISGQMMTRSYRSREMTLFQSNTGSLNKDVDIVPTTLCSTFYMKTNLMSSKIHDFQTPIDLWKLKDM